MSFAIFIYEENVVDFAEFINGDLQITLPFEPGSSQVKIYRIDSKLQCSGNDLFNQSPSLYGLRELFICRSQRV